MTVYASITTLFYANSQQKQILRVYRQPQYLYWARWWNLDPLVSFFSYLILVSYEWMQIRLDGMFIAPYLRYIYDQYYKIINHCL